MGRKKDEFWQYVDTSNGNKCIFCGHEIPGASRIKFHLAQVTGQGIRTCNKVPDDVKSAAVSALNSPNKRVKQSKAPSDLDENDASSSLPRSSTTGLKALNLIGLPSLSTLCNENAVASSFLPFSHLTKLSVELCNGIKKLLTPGMSTQLHNLAEIEVGYCRSMEEVFSGKSTNFHDPGLNDAFWLPGFNDVLCLPEEREANEAIMDDSNVEAIKLPNLKSVVLLNLSQLKSVCKGTIECCSLQKFQIIGCPELELVPQTQPHFDIQVK